MNKGIKVLISALIMASLIAVTGCSLIKDKTTKNNDDTKVETQLEGDKDSDTVDTNKTTDDNKTTDSNTDTNTNTDKPSDNTTTNKDNDTNTDTNTNQATLQDDIAQYVKKTYGDKSNVGKDRIINASMQPGSTGKRTLMVDINADSNNSAKKVLTEVNKISKDIIAKTQELTKKENLAQDIEIKFYLPIGANGSNEMIYQVDVEGVDVLKKDWSSIDPNDLKNNASVIRNEEYFSLNP